VHSMPWPGAASGGSGLLPGTATAGFGSGGSRGILWLSKLPRNKRGTGAQVLLPLPLPAPLCEGSCQSQLYVSMPCLHQ
jgi:hypothetical protein